jgi:hypothetical protein
MKKRLSNAWKAQAGISRELTHRENGRAAEAARPVGPSLF